MPIRRIVAAIITCVCTAHAAAHMPTRVFPTTTLWQTQPANVANDPRFAAMQSLTVHVAADYFPHQNNPTPQNAAILLCNTDRVELRRGTCRRRQRVRRPARLRARLVPIAAGVD